MQERRAHGVAVASAALAVTTTVATFAPWASSGSKVRNSYAIVGIVDRAGVLSSSAAGLSGLWYFVPALCGVVLIAMAAGRVAIGAGAATTLGGIVAVGGLLVARSPLVLEPGATIAALAGVFTMVAGAVSLGIQTRRRDDERSMGTDGSR